MEGSGPEMQLVELSQLDIAACYMLMEFLDPALGSVVWENNVNDKNNLLFIYEGGKKILLKNQS